MLLLTSSTRPFDAYDSRPRSKQSQMTPLTGYQLSTTVGESESIDVNEVRFIYKLFYRQYRDYNIAESLESLKLAHRMEGERFLPLIMVGSRSDEKHKSIWY